MKKAFDIDELEARIGRLPHSHGVAFAALCCERLLPNYAAFTKHVGWGQPELLRKGLDAVWSWLSDADVSETDLSALRERCDQVVPDTENFTTALVSAALDAGAAVVETLSCCLERNPRKIAEVASFARDTVDMFIRECEGIDGADPELARKVDGHPLMLRELERQQEDLQLLEDTVEVTPGLVHELQSADRQQSGIDPDALASR